MSRQYDREQGRRSGPAFQEEEWPAPQPWRYTAYGRRVLDAELRNSVRRRLLEDTALDSDQIEVEVEDGIVTLSGRVGDYLHARYAWDDAWETQGAEGVVSRIQVEIAEGADPEQSTKAQSEES